MKKSNISFLILIILGVCTVFASTVAFCHFQDIFGDGIVLNNYDGVDHYYDGRATFFISLTCSVILGIILVVFYKKTKPLES